MTDRVHYRAELDLLDGSGAAVAVDRFYVHERPAGGWSGYVAIPAGDPTVSIENMFNVVTAFRVMPGMPVALGLWCNVLVAGGPSASGTERTSGTGTGTTGSTGAHKPVAVPLRTWPSVVTEVTVGLSKPDHSPLCHVRFADPLTYLGNRRIWGVFRDRSPGEMLGGAISLALNGDGMPTQIPSMAGFPPLLINQSLRSTLKELPYAIAAGEPLRRWLDHLVARLGVRIDMAGQADGGIKVTLRDHPPENSAIPMTVNDGVPDSSNAVVSEQRHNAWIPRRDTLLDNPAHGPSRRVSGFGSVEELVTAAEADLDEARFRADFGADRSDIELSVLKSVTGQPGLHPGRRVGFTNRSVNGATKWQAASVEHGFNDATYRNVALLLKDGVSWRPASPPHAGTVLLDGVVGDGASDSGAAVPRDRLGRIPVTFAFLCNAGEEDAGEGGSSAGDAAPPSVSLSVRDPMAGGSHGFVPEHRNGDRCRIMVHHPLRAEVSGFRHDDSRRIGEHVADSTMGIIMDNQPDQWSGMLFRPKDALESSEGDGEGDDTSAAGGE